MQTPWDKSNHSGTKRSALNVTIYSSLLATMINVLLRKIALDVGSISLPCYAENIASTHMLQEYNTVF